MATLSWALDRIREWRNEAGDSRVPDRERLEAVLRSLHRRRVHAGFALYLVLGCEWLFRMRLDGGDRHIVALDDTTMPIEVADSATWTPAEPRPRPGGRTVSTRPGPVPRPIAWIVSELVARRLARTRRGKGEKGEALAFGLARALMGKYRQVNRGEFRRARETLRGGAAEQLLANFERWFYEYLPSSCAGLDWRRQWADGIRSTIDVMGPRHTFPVAPEIVAGLFNTYRAPGRQRNQKPVADAT
jgi:hypothetical protein